MEEVSRLINQRTGIQLGIKQVAMVESRLKRRFHELGLAGFEEYEAYFDSHRESEIETLVSLLTTHHTFFFREFVQFEFLEQQLPALVSAARARGTKTLEIYSAACSRGQEVYSLAMHLKKHLKEVAPDFNFRIFASDVDPASVEIAKNGVYHRNEIKSVPLTYLESHWARGTAEISDFVKAKKTLRDHCEFATVNLISPKGLEGRKFDVIFCRNVFIYFTPPQIKSITERLMTHLIPGGLFFIGVSESLHSLGLPLRGVGASVYSTELPKEVKKAKTEISKAVPAPAAIRPAAVIPNPLRVVCVDDSASILSLLKKILSKEHGFEVVATAGNGQEAVAVIQRERPHLVTLDIHMPVRTGVEFLEDTKGKERPPVVMVTSVSRDDAALAWKTLSLGAADYVEKPALNNLEERADEIRAKLRSAFRSKEKPAAGKALDKEFARDAKVKSPASCASVYVFGLGETEACVKVMKEMSAFKIPSYLVVEGADAILPSLAEKISKETGIPITTDFSEPKMGTVIVTGSLKNTVQAVKKQVAISVMVFGEVSKHGAESLFSLSGAQLLLGDLGSGKGAAPLADLANDVVLPSSFAYLAHQFFTAKSGKV